MGTSEGVRKLASRRLSNEELQRANLLLDDIRKMLIGLGGEDAELLFAYRRKLWKELSFDERSKPAYRAKLKRQMHKAQDGKCACCQRDIPISYSVLDRFEAHKGYIASNVRLICQECDRKIQTERGFR